RPEPPHPSPALADAGSPRAGRAEERRDEQRASEPEAVRLTLPERVESLLEARPQAVRDGEDARDRRQAERARNEDASRHAERRPHVREHSSLRPARSPT